MKFMIRSDIEGVTGVTTYEQAESSDFGKEMLLSDLNAAIEGLLSDNDHQIIIYDEHTDGRNIDLRRVNEKVSVIMGKPEYRPDWGGIDSSYDAMIMVGFHARSGVDGALLPHSYSRKNLNISINDKVVGEIGLEAAVAGDFGVPLVMVTGDSAGVEEAKQLIPQIEAISVKEAMGEFQANCLPPSRTKKLIYDAAKKISSNLPKVKPLKFSSPVEIKIELAQSEYLDKLSHLFGEYLVNKNTVLIQGQTVTNTWSKYLQIQKEVKGK